MEIFEHANILKYHKMRGFDVCRVRIATYSLNVDFAVEQLSLCTVPVDLICHSKFATEAAEVWNRCEKSDLEIRIHPETHIKLLLLDGICNVHVGSANFNRSTWHETDICFTHIEMHKRYASLFQCIWKEATPIRNPFLFLPKLHKERLG